MAGGRALGYRCQVYWVARCVGLAIVKASLQEGCIGLKRGSISGLEMRKEVGAGAGG